MATMGQSDLQLYEKMNVRCDCLIANQNGTWDYQEEETPFGTVRMISSATKGVGINRNLALSNARGDILLLADDDVRYYDDTFTAVEEAFARLPDADVIAFGMDMTRKGKLSARRSEPCKRRNLWNSMRFGACRLAIRRSAVLKYGLSFSELFGGGCRYSCGEDTLFLQDCFRKKMKVYSHCHVLGTCARDESSWFSGYGEKYFFDKGAMLACGFKRTKHLIKWYYIWKFSKKTELPLRTVIQCTNEGIKAFREIKSFEEAMEERGMCL